MYIRPAIEEDLKAIVEIYNSTIDSRVATADTRPIEVESRLSWFHDRDVTCRPIWVVDINPKIAQSEVTGIEKLGDRKIVNLFARRSQKPVVAWLSFNDFYGRPAYKYTAEISLYVAKDYRGQGIADGLVKKAITECPKLRIKSLLAFVFGHNIPSVQLFAKHGFTRWGLLPQVAEMDKQERDLLILGRRIKAPSVVEGSFNRRAGDPKE
ncbi:sortase-like acyltransferase [Xenococcus sp. PCC 7305]|uniref:GNAT family N-acetyltransferase n=1 Tax=Xenococcus sp. PCC 7305 TaxID=102125 RepID=UPI0002ACE1AF|nr:GNAT family N-acetyltransferase [Xenococcus sp. PCC 7305]ELS02611.1 sortase-like acyltransferase [Xenococcus sp. PCC 7305]